MAKRIESRVAEINNEIFKLDTNGKIEEFGLTKKVRNFNLKKDDWIEWEKNGPNFNIIKKIEKPINNKNNQNNNYSKSNRKNNKKETDYDFIPLGDNVLHKGKVVLGDKSGVIHCILKNTTKMSIINSSNGYIISASTLKGMIRNIIDILTNSVVRNLTPSKNNKGEIEVFNYKKEKNNKKLEKQRLINEYNENRLKFIPEQFRETNKEENFSFSERVFGTVGNKEFIKDLENVTNYQGRVYFTDAKPTKIPIVEKNVELELMEPEPKFTDDKKMVKGRKIYLHKQTINTKKGNNQNIKSKVDIVKENTEFLFEVHFEKLTEDELGILLYSLMLDGPVTQHKVGRGKALGYGSISIAIKECLIEKKEEKYKLFSIKNTYKNISKQELISKVKQRYNVNGRENVKKLFEILRKS